MIENGTFVGFPLGSMLKFDLFEKNIVTPKEEHLILLVVSSFNPKTKPAGKRSQNDHCRNHEAPTISLRSLTAPFGEPPPQAQTLNAKRP